MKKKSLIKDEKVNAIIEQDGFTTIPFLKSDEVEALQVIFIKHYGNSPQPVVFNTLETNEAERRKKIHEDIVAVCKHKIDAHFANYKIIIAVFFIKNPAEISHVGIHGDPSMTLEGYSHLGIWIPLVDTNERNGSMHFLRQSQNLFPPYYAKTIPPPFDKSIQTLDPCMESVDMTAGDALIFDNSTVHCSTSNHSGRPRIAAGIKIIDKDAQLISFFRDPNQNGGKIEIIAQEDDYYLSPLWDDAYTRPRAGRSIGFLNHEIKSLNERELQEMLKKRSRRTEQRFFKKVIDFFS